MTFWDLVTKAAEEMPDKVILADDYGRSLTASQYRDVAERVAAGLDVGAGDVVSWQLPTVLEAPVLMAALSRLGAVQNPIITALGRREVGIITSQLKTSTFVAPVMWRKTPYAEIARDLGCQVLALDLEGVPGPDLRLPMGDPADLPAPPTEDGRWIYYTSGTTSEPKGAQHTDTSLIAASYGMTELGSFAGTDVYPVAWPLPHIGGFVMFAISLRLGMQMILFDSWDPKTTPERMAAYDPTILGAAQPFFRAYLDAQHQHGDEPMFPSLRMFTAGGAPTSVELVREIVDTFDVQGVIQAYGMTEFPIASAAGPTDPPEVLLTSVGQLSPGVQLRLVDGEIRVKGPQAFQGYVDSSLDAAAFDEDGWICTGDVGELRDGYLYITGRVKDVIIRNAENISALEVEDIVMRHPDVLDVTVVGLPDPRTGERLCAVIVTSEGKVLDVADVAAHCLAHGLAKHKCPEQVEIVAELDRNSMGKVLKEQIRSRLGAPIPSPSR